MIGKMDFYLHIESAHTVRLMPYHMSTLYMQVKKVLAANKRK